MAYSDLTEHEQHVWDEYETLRAITDWDGFTDAQANRKQAARDWLVDQRKEIWRCAEGEKDCDGGAGWDVNNRRARYDQLSDDSLNNGVHEHEYTLPANGCTPAEKSYIEEREGYLMIGGDGQSADDAQRARKTDNSDWLVDRREQLYSLIASSSDADNDANYRHQRYENLCIATHYGDDWTSYEASHNKYGQATHDDDGGDGGGSSRTDCIAHAKTFLGVSESPPDSNRGDPEPSKWERRVLGYDGEPWCACFAVCMAWDSGCQGAGSAGVEQNISYAKGAQGIYRGFTTDPGSALHGDHVAIGCSSCHQGVLAETPGAGATHVRTIEGNTSPGDEGSQYNGGCVAEKTRPISDIVGFMLVDFPG